MTSTESSGETSGPTLTTTFRELLPALSGGAAILFFVGWLSLESFYRQFGITAGEAGLTVTDATRLAGVQVGVIAASVSLGWAFFRVVLVYDEPGAAEFSKIRIAPLGNWMFALIFIAPWGFVVVGGWPFGGESNGALGLLVVSGLTTGAALDHLMRTERGKKSPLRVGNVLLLLALLVTAGLLALIPTRVARDLRGGRPPTTRSLWVLPPATQVIVTSASTQVAGCGLLIGHADGTYLVWDYDTSTLRRFSSADVLLTYERC